MASDAPPTAPPKLPSAKKSGAAGRKERRLRAKAEQLREQQAGERVVPGLPAQRPPEFAHLETLEVLQAQLRDIGSDTKIPPSERRRLICDTAKAIASQQTKAEWERQVLAMNDKVRSAQDELFAQRLVFERERKSYRELRTQLLVTAAKAGVVLPEEVRGELPAAEATAAELAELGISEEVAVLVLERFLVRRR